MKAVVFIVLGLLSVQASALVKPDRKLTPGDICLPSDPDFSNYDYPTKVARCKRAVNDSEKEQVADDYGISRIEWRKFEFDHLIPLCAGGSNSLENIWPQPLVEADGKDKLEMDICLALKAGTMTQAQAVRKIRGFFYTSKAKASELQLDALDELAAELEAE